MSDTNTAADEAESNYADDVLWRLTGAKITSIGGNEAGEIYLTTLNPRDGKPSEFIIGIDPDCPGGVAIFEVERKTVVVEDLPDDCYRCGAPAKGTTCVSCIKLNGGAA
jgi:hypothetical protein